MLLINCFQNPQDIREFILNKKQNNLTGEKISNNTLVTEIINKDRNSCKVGSSIIMKIDRKSNIFYKKIKQMRRNSFP